MAARAGIVAALVLLVMPGVGAGGTAVGATGAEVPIVFGTKTRPDPGIGVVNADGSGRRIVVAPPTENDSYVQPDLSPDGQRIVFTACNELQFRYPEAYCDLATVNVDGSGFRTLGRGNQAGHWSPDGRQIAAVRFQEYTHEPHLSVISADGSTFRDVAQTWVEDVDWSPDGKTLVFSSTEPDGERPPFRKSEHEDPVRLLYTVPADGSSKPRLLGTGISGRDPSWSPDGTQIAFKRLANGGNPAVSVVNPDGSGLRDIVRSDSTGFGRPGWSPDSKRLAFATPVNQPDGSTRTPASIYDLVTGSLTPVLPTGGGSLSWASGSAPSSCTSGYWLVAGDGGVFTFGTAGFFGSARTARPRRPVVGMAPSPSGRGYWLVASDGGVFSFGDAEFYGSTSALTLNKPVVSIAASPSWGYWLVGADGGIFTFGDAPQVGSAASPGLPSAIVGSSATGAALLIAGADGTVVPFGHARFCGSMSRQSLRSPTVGTALVP